MDGADTKASRIYLGLNKSELDFDIKCHIFSQ